MNVRTFDDLQVGDYLYIVDNESYSYNPIRVKITDIKGDTFSTDTKFYETLCLNFEEGSEMAWEETRCLDVYSDKEVMINILMAKIVELSQFCKEITDYQ